MFDLQHMKVHILDPCHSDKRRELHEQICAMVHSSLISCIDAFFDGWHMKPFGEWAVQYPKLSDTPFPG